MTSCSFSTIRERDMDLLFMEAIITDPDFLKLIISKTQYSNALEYKILDAALSLTEPGLGESDITVITEIDGQKVALLIEDKVDAIAMPDQYQRYVERGKRGIKAGKYQDFEIFIFCPDKYYENNTEAPKYNHFLSYEECLKYFRTKNDLLSNVRSQQLEQAISKAKKPPEAIINEKANAFFNKYLQYQKEHYPELDMRTSETSNGWWPHYGTSLGKAYIYHKTQEGFIDLTFPNGSAHLDRLMDIAAWLRSHKIPNVYAVKTGNAATLRIEVPKLNVLEPFENTDTRDLEECFSALMELYRFSNMVKCAQDLSIIQKKKQS